MGLFDKNKIISEKEVTMLVAVAGSQGSGKSLTLHHLSLAVGEFSVVTRKTSRSILEEWGVTLQQVNNDPKLTLQFQEIILRRKSDDEAIGTYSNSTWLTERTYADLFTYALISLGKDNDHTDWLDTYYQQCLEACQTYDYVFYLKGGHFTVEHDGVRGSSPYYSRMVDLTMLDITKQMIHPSRLSIIDVPDLSQRISIIKTQIKHLR